MEINMEINMINEELELHLDNMIQNMKDMTEIIKRSRDYYEDFHSYLFYWWFCS